MKVTEIRWHARGGQGTMLAARMLARVAINDGKHAQGMPEFGPERMGAPMRAYNRISTKKFSLYCNVVNPDIVVVLDSSLIDTVNVREGVNKDGLIIVNTSRTPAEVRKQLQADNGIKVYTLDANGISIAALGRPMPNMPMLGALAKITGLVSLQTLLDDTKLTFGEKFSPKVLEANLTALKRGHDELKGE